MNAHVNKFGPLLKIFKENEENQIVNMCKGVFF